MQSIPFRECSVLDLCDWMFAKPILRPCVNVSIIDCAGSPINHGLKLPKVSATNVTAHTNLWTFGFGSRTMRLCALVHHALGAHTPTPHYAAVSRFPYILSKSVPHQKHDLLFELVVIWPFSSTLFESRYLSVMCHPSSIRACRISMFKVGLGICHIMSPKWFPQGSAGWAKVL